jgi:RNA 2',3'-cyclic 3'-phosphodiesterase
MRLFVGIFPPEDVRAELLRRLREAGGSSGQAVRLTPVDRWHLTLMFLGEVADGDLDAVEPAISHAVDGARGGLRLRLSGGGTFGDVLWAGVDGDLDGLRRLHHELLGAFEAAGLPVDMRPLTPHLTVSYRGKGLLQALRGYAGPEWTADEVVLVHSRHADGGGYETLRRWSL